jgi:hypothetical protein
MQVKNIKRLNLMQLLALNLINVALKVTINIFCEYYSVN